MLLRSGFLRFEPVTTGPMVFSPLPKPAYPIALPARWTRLQRLKNTCIYGLLRLVHGCLRAIPWLFVPAMAQLIGHVAWAVAFGERRRAVRQMRQAMPELSARACHGYVRGMFVHLAMCLFELLHLPRLLEGPDGVAFTDAQKALVHAAMQAGRGVVAVTGHIGNWELLAQTFAHAGIAAHTFAKPLYDPRLTAWVDRERRKHGLGVLWRGAPGGVKDMLRVFRTGEMLALLIDQDTQVDGCFVPFFGRPAHTPTAAASLALRFNAPILFFYTHRTKHGHSLVVVPIPTRPDAERQAEVRRITTELSAQLQAAIEQAPAQWVWMHQRWKQQSPEIDP